MIEIRIHGRGGQGAVIASTLLAIAAFKEGKNAQSFPLFGGERRGAPVKAFVRLSQIDEIIPRCHIYEPQFVIVLHSSLLKYPDVWQGIKPHGTLLYNGEEKHLTDVNIPEGLSINLFTANANHISVENGLGKVGIPSVNAAMLGAFAKSTGLLSLKSILESIEEVVPSKILENKKAAEDAFNQVSEVKRGQR